MQDYSVKATIKFLRQHPAIDIDAVMNKICYARIILPMDPANERQRFIETLPFIGRAHMQNDPCVMIQITQF